MADAKANGVVARALQLLRERFPPHRRIGYSPDEKQVLVRGAKEHLASLSDAEIEQELERRARSDLVDLGLTQRRNVRPPRPETPFDERIGERKVKEKELRQGMDEAKARYLTARDELKAARLLHPPNPDAEERAEHAARDAEWTWKRAEEDWKRCRSGRRALKMAADRWIADQETIRSQERRQRRRQRR